MEYELLQNKIEIMNKEFEKQQENNKKLSIEYENLKLDSKINETNKDIIIYNLELRYNKLLSSKEIEICNAKFKVASKCAIEFEKVLNFSKKFNQESSNRLPKFPTSCPKFLQNESKSSEIQTEQNSNYKVTRI